MTATDLVVVLPGITGSTLHQNGKTVWEPSGGAVLNAIVTLGHNLKKLQLPDGIGDGHPGDGVEPKALMPDLHLVPGLWSPIQGYTGLLQRLGRMREQGKVGKVLPVPYDWRLSNRFNGQRLAGIVADELGSWRDSDPARRDAQLVIVCHSMGGLVARWFLEQCGGAALTRKLITLGTPYRGAARAVDQLVNGAPTKLGPLSVDLSAFTRSMPSLYQLLPEYACVVDEGGVMRRLDEIATPGLVTARRDDALRFHRDLAAAEEARPASAAMTHAIVGTRQPTATSVRVLPLGVEVLETIGADNDYGDATVPLAGALRRGMTPDTHGVYRIADRHGALQSNPVVLDEIEAIITAKSVGYRALPPATVRVRAPELVLMGDSIAVGVEIEPDVSGRVPAVRVTLAPADMTATTAPVTHQPRIRDQHAETAFTPSGPGAYHVKVTGIAPGSVTPITATTLVWAT